MPTVSRRRRATAVLVAALAALSVTPLATAGASDGWPIRPDVAATPDGSGDLEVTGSGWGHSVGMSQYGARAQAVAGRAPQAILGHYYPGTAVGTRPTDDPGAQAGRPIRVGLVAGVSQADVRLVSGSVIWRRCTADTSCQTITGVTHAVDQTLTVHRRSGGAFEIRRGSTSLATVPGGDGVFLAADHDGSVLEGPNPVTAGGRATYRHGRTEFAQRGDGQLTVSQRVPTVELYLRGLAEMPSSWPDAALRSQAIVGRTYALRMLSAGLRSDCRCHLLASPRDQAYTGWVKENEGNGAGQRWTAAVQGSARQVVTYQGELAQTYYSSSHGGRSENIEDSWAYGTATVPYLRSVDDPWSVAPEAGNPRAEWTATLPAERLRSLVSERLHTVSRVEVRDRTAGGTPRTLRFTGSDRAGQPVTIDWPDGGKPAGARLRAAYGAGLLPSQQLSRIAVGSDVPFTDIGGSGHVPAIRFAYDAGITTGVTPTAFRPADPVTREQMASFIARTFELPSGDGGRFDDVGAGSQHAAAIGSLSAAGITQGCRGDDFCPRDPVTREQMASFLARALGLPTTGVAPFDDVGAGSTHAGAIRGLADSGITTGCETGRYCPRDPVTRGQMATFLQRAVRSR